MKLRTFPSLFALALFAALPLHGQDAAKPTEKPSERARNSDPMPGYNQAPLRFFHLQNAANQNQANEILVALRNALSPFNKIYLVVSNNTIVMAAPPEQLDLAEKIIHELDRQRSSYRVTFTITTLDNGQRTGTSHFDVVMENGQRGTFKQGNKIPVVTGTFKPESASSETQYTYLDIGLNFTGVLERHNDGVSLEFKIEQSSVAPEQSSVGANDPVIRQAVLESSAQLTAGKATHLGGIDIPGSTRHLDITASLDPIL